MAPWRLWNNNLRALVPRRAYIAAAGQMFARKTRIYCVFRELHNTKRIKLAVRKLN